MNLAEWARFVHTSFCAPGHGRRPARDRAQKALRCAALTPASRAAAT